MDSSENFLVFTQVSVITVLVMLINTKIILFCSRER